MAASVPERCSKNASVASLKDYITFILNTILRELCSKVEGCHEEVELLLRNATCKVKEFVDTNEKGDEDTRKIDGDAEKLLAKETEDLKSQFRSLFAWTIRLVKLMNLETILSWLPIEMREICEHAKTAEDLFSIKMLLPRITWCNFNVLEYIIPNIDDSNLKTEYAKYKSRFQAYAETRVTLLTPGVSNNSKDRSHDCLNYLVIKTDHEWGRNLISEIKECLISSFNLPREIFLESIASGCISVECRIPPIPNTILLHMVVTGIQQRNSDLAQLKSRHDGLCNKKEDEERRPHIKIMSCQ